jgi:alpha-tubulin suppressor-like RCC1 family protein
MRLGFGSFIDYGPRTILVALLVDLGMCNTPPPDRKTFVSVEFGGAGSGTVASAGGEVHCSTLVALWDESACSAPLSKGTQLTLTATSASGSMFAGWGGACSGVSSTCSVRFDQDKTVVAYFRRSTKMVAAGGYHTCVLRPAGDVVCWGRNSDGQIGNGTATPKPSLVSSVVGMSNAVAVATGGYHTCALLAGGTVQCWGNNKEGALGLGTNTNASAPISVPGISDAIAITAGAFHSCALRANRSVMCWGLNADGQLGDGTTSDSSIPRQVSEASLPRLAAGRAVSVTSISAGGFHTCAVRTNFSVVCWGLNADGQLGVGFQGPEANGTIGGPVLRARPAPVTTDVLAASSVAAAIGVGQVFGAQLGGYHTCAIGTDKDVYCWGNNNDLQASRTQILASTIGMPGGSYLMVAAGAYHTCALRVDGVYCQGHSSDGEIGIGTFSHVVGGPLLGTAGAFHLAAGGFHTCAVLSNTPTGTVACWGNNGDGQVDGGFAAEDKFAAPHVLNKP